ncbi:extracellular solute-binding protein [Streptomyces sp. AV19]|uniref:extracellular solute-binding protein n=1 Tax=Streptomyces sp. AV19 TaxID=2793068 RepID=UPI0018FE3C77|nr:extracellular solute-binding protein [Streptomyces sp. AV19]MBH1937159.1 extracellular solute-binding protein [Streptomyces sp. AV19]MDG4533186.1 extracellular solute-binding protein [Streptomyces sp. AV19]
MERPVWARSSVWCAALLLGAIACTGQDGAGGHAGRTAERPVTGTQLVIATGLDVTGKYGIRKRLVDAWNALQEKQGSPYRARAVLLPGSADLQRSQLLAALQSGSAGYDVVNLDVTWVPEFAAAGLVRELPAEYADDGDVLPKAAATARWKGKVYAAPYNSDVGLLYYRRDYLSAAGIDENKLRARAGWDELSALMNTTDAWARAEKSDRKGDYRNAWTSQLGPYEGLTVNATEAFASAGVRLTDDDGAYTATPGELEKGVAEFRRRTESAHTLDGAFESDEATTLEDFAEGRTAFLRHWPYAYRTLHAALGEERLGVVPLPGSAVLGGQDLAVAANPAMPAARVKKAQELVRFLTDRTSERCLLDAGFAATRRSAYTDPGVTCDDRRAAPGTSAPSEGGERDMPRDAARRPRYARTTLLPALESAVLRPRTPLYGAFTQAFTAQLSRLHTSPASRSETDEDVAKDLHAALRGVLPGG